MLAAVTPGFIPHIPFGLDPVLVAVTLLIVTYVFIIGGRHNRAVVALLGAAAVIGVGRARSGRGGQGHRLGYHRPSHRDHDSGRDRAAVGAVPVSGDLVGAAGQGKPRRHPVDAAAYDGGALRASQQCLDGAPDRAGDARDRRGTRHPALSVSVRGSVRLQHRRHRDADRRPAQYSDRLAGRARFQRLPRQSRAGRRADHGRAGDHGASRLGPLTPGESAKPRAGHGHERAGHDHRLGAAVALRRGA